MSKQTNDAQGGKGRALHIAGVAVRAVLWSVLGLFLAYNLYMLVARYVFGVGIPTVFGYGFAAVETGSMEPAIGKGDFIVVKAEDTYSEGDVITFLDAEQGVYVTHRIIQVSPSGYTTKGDANNVQDAFTVPHGAVVGRVAASVPALGTVIGFLQTPAGLFALVACGVAVWAVTSVAAQRKKK